MSEETSRLLTDMGRTQQVGNKNKDTFILACVLCGEEKELTLTAHRNMSGKVCGWLVACVNCQPKLCDFHFVDAKTAFIKDKEYQNGTCVKCGGILSKNPHPAAGNPDLFLEVGTRYVCIPCEVKANRERIHKISRLQAECQERILKWLKRHNDFNECGIERKGCGLLLTTSNYQALKKKKGVK